MMAPSEMSDHPGGVAGEASTDLHEAARIGDLNGVKALLAAETSVDARDQFGRTPLHEAVASGDPKVVKALLDGRADVNSSAQYGLTSLHIAAQEGRPDVAQVLLQHGASVSARTAAGSTPLHYAAALVRPDCVKVLLAFRAEVNATDDSGGTPLLVAVKEGSIDVVQALLEGHADAKIPAKTGWTPLHAAADEWDIEIVKALLRNGADPNARDENGVTPLHAAWGQSDFVAVLLERGADVTARTRKQVTPLHCAAGADEEVPGGADGVQMLLQRGADVNARDQRGRTPLHWAAWEGRTDAVKVLLAGRATVDALDQQRRTPLYRAARQGHIDVAKALLDSGADVKASDKLGRTPLHGAFLGRHGASVSAIGVVRALLDRGADVNARDGNGQTPLHLAAPQQGREVETIVTMLRERGASVDLRDRRGQTPADIARESGRKDIAAALLSEPAATLPEMSVATTKPTDMLDPDQPTVFFLAGLKDLILREVAIALGPAGPADPAAPGSRDGQVLERLTQLETNGYGEWWPKRGDWWAYGVLPYLRKEDEKGLKIFCFGKEEEPKKELKDVSSDDGKKWFREKIKDVYFLLKYMMSWRRPQDKDSNGSPKGPWRVWPLLFEKKRYPEDQLEALMDLRNKFAHPLWEQLTREDMGKAIVAAGELFKTLELPQAEERVRELRYVGPILDEVKRRIPGNLLARSQEVLRPVEFRNVAHLRNAVESEEIVPFRDKRQLVTVVGTFTPRLLLEQFRLKQKADEAPQRDRGRWSNRLQEWLFQGLTDWAPSWDPRVSARGDPHRLVGQLAPSPGDGCETVDEGQSVCVVLRGNHAKTARDSLQEHSWGGDENRQLWSGGFGAKLTGRLCFQKHVLSELRHVLRGQDDFCIVVDDDGGEFECTRRTTSYTGYLWKCIVPEIWMPHRRAVRDLRFTDVIFIWEHTEFTDQEAVMWSLESIRGKCDYFERRYGHSRLVEKSDPILDGDPEGRLPVLLAGSHA